MNERLLQEQRIRSRAVFQRIFRDGKKARGRFLQIWAAPGAAQLEPSISGRPQVAVIVSRRVSPLAHVRNRWKRRVREIFRRSQSTVKPGTGTLIQVLGGNKVSLEEIRAELFTLLKKTGSLS